MKNKIIKKHELEYIHIRKKTFNLFWKIPLAIIPFFLAYLTLVYGIIKNWKYLGLDLLSEKIPIYSNSNLLIIPMLFLEYFLISFSI